MKAGAAFLFLLLAGCGSPTTSEPASSRNPNNEGSEAPVSEAVAEPPPSEPAPPTEETLRAALAPALDPAEDGRELALSMRPEAADFDAVFVEGSAATVRDAVLPLFDDPAARIDPRSPARTEILIRSASTEELAAAGDAAGGLPGGMTRIASHLRPGVRWYHAKFVEPGHTSGLSMTAFVFVSGRWVWFPMPWRALD
ncbi:MAG: hypothetical protein AB8I08_27315 [Sandaracinaceae bacterium]